MMKYIEFIVALVVAIALVLYVAIWVSGDTQVKVTAAIEYTGLIIVFFFGFIILASMAPGKIDVSGLLEEKVDGAKDDGAKGDGDKMGKASMSRFQLLLFTFVIAISLFLIVVNSTDKFPDIPTNVLLLLGISATTYGVSKGIQASSSSGSDADDQKSGANDQKKTE